MKKFTTLPEMIAIHAQDTPDAIAITAPAAKPLTYRALHLLVENTVNALNKLGVGRGDRVGIVLPNCPEMAAAFVAIASGCTAAPLNMAYRADEFEFYLERPESQGAGRRERERHPGQGRRSKTGHRDTGTDAASGIWRGQFHAQRYSTCGQAERERRACAEPTTSH